MQDSWTLMIIFVHKPIHNPYFKILTAQAENDIPLLFSDETRFA